MKPRTKLQRRIVAASGRLPEITPAQLHWGYAHLLPHEAFRTKRGKNHLHRMSAYVAG